MAKRSKSQSASGKSKGKSKGKSIGKSKGKTLSKMFQPAKKIAGKAKQKKENFKKLSTKDKLKKVGKIAVKAAIASTGVGGAALVLASQTKKGKKVTAKVKAKAKGKLKHPFDVMKKVGSAVKSKMKGKAKGKLKDAAEFIALRPFKGLMVMALKKKGINVSKKASLKTIAALFYVNIISKKGNSTLESFNPYPFHLEHADEVKEGEVEKAAWDTAKEVAANSGIPGSSLAVGIVRKIINYFKGIQKKKKAKKLQQREADLMEDLKEAKEKGDTDAIEKIEKEIAEIDKEQEKEELTPEEKEATGNKPLDKDEEEIAEKTDKVQDELAKVTPGTENSSGEVEKELKKDGTKSSEAVKPKTKSASGSKSTYGVFGFFRGHHHGTKLEQSDSDSDNE